MKEITVFILCGGKSSRMLSEKGLVLFQGKPFIERIIEVVLPITSNIVLVANNSKYDYLPYTKVKDIAVDKGPLGGIYTALEYSESESNLILSCDIPLITTELLTNLIDKHDDEADITILSSQSRIHPLIGIYSKRIVGAAKAAIEKDQLKLQNFIVTVPHQIITFDESLAYQFTNINSPDELDQLTNEINGL